MMSEKDLLRVYKNLTKLLELYIKAIKDKYGCYMSDIKLKQLDSLDNYDNIIKIHKYGSINGYANNTSVNVPLCADKVFNIVKKIPGYGINKNHKTCDDNNLIINDNTFFYYIIHVFISGMNTADYFEDLLLHEVMHFCGSGGATALKEGINELLTRKTALEYGFRTSGCGYPKEVGIAYQLQEIFGENIIDQIAFLNREKDILSYLELNLGRDASLLYEMVSMEMEKEFHDKYYKKMDSYNGICGILKKVSNYKKIDYSNVYILIDEYKKNKLDCIDNKICK